MVSKKAKECTKDKCFYMIKGKCEIRVMPLINPEGQCHNFIDGSEYA